MSIKSLLASAICAMLATSAFAATPHSSLAAAEVTNTSSGLPPLMDPKPTVKSKTNAPVPVADAPMLDADDVSAPSSGTVNNSAQSASPSFNKALSNVQPLNPDEIRQFLKEIDARQQASAPAPPLAETVSMPVSLEPGSRPPQVSLSPGYATAILLIDSSGAAWPITSAIIGDPTAFSVLQPEGSSNTVTVSPLTPYAASNLVLTLKDAPAPVVIFLETTNKTSHYRVAMMVQSRGPNAHAPTASLGAPAIDDVVMRNLLDGVVPEGAHPVALSGGDAQAFKYDNRLFLRTRMVLRWPAYVAALHGVDDMNLYEIPAVPSMTCADENGQIAILNIDDGALLLDNALASRMPVGSVAPVAYTNPYSPKATSTATTNRNATP